MKEVTAQCRAGKEIIEEFVKNKKGKTPYRSWLNRYFNTIGIKEPTNYFKSNRDYDKDIITFAESIKHWSPATFRGALACIRTFFIFNNVDLQPKTKYQLREFQDNYHKAPYQGS